MPEKMNADVAGLYQRLRESFDPSGVMIEQLPKRNGARAWSLTSQVWNGRPWQHTLTITEPKLAHPTDGYYLEITGDDVGEPDDQYARDLADAAGVPVVTLFNVPNQPLDDRREDDLIAHTFERFLDTGDPDDLALTPMVRSVFAALHIVPELTEGQMRDAVVGGASKRGWTTWLVGASGHPAVKGLVPVVFDNLRMAEQTLRQQEQWGTTSPMIDDYVRRDLHVRASEPEGRRLVQTVDPYHHLEQVEVPALVVNGTNDPYWTADALTVYLDELPTGSQPLVVPNLSHSTGERPYWTPAFGRFVRERLSGRPMGRFNASVRADHGYGVISWSSTDHVHEVRVWTAASPDKQFNVETFESELVSGFGHEGSVTLAGRDDAHQAVVIEALFEDPEGQYRLTGPCFILPQRS